MQFSTEILINAPIDKVWRIVSDVDKYPTWKSGVTKVEGHAVLGSTIKLFSEVSPSRAFSLKVSELVPNKKLTLSSGMPFGLFSGIRTYTLEETSNGVKFNMIEIYSGFMSSIITKSIPNLNPSFKKFAEGLKSLSEK